jgi:hypothetical protein
MDSLTKTTDSPIKTTETEPIPETEPTTETEPTRKTNFKTDTR